MFHVEQIRKFMNLKREIREIQDYSKKDEIFKYNNQIFVKYS